MSSTESAPEAAAVPETLPGEGAPGGGPAVVQSLDALSFAATVSAVLLPLLIVRKLLGRCGARSDRAPRLSKTFQKYRVVGRRVVSKNETRPVMYLTLGVETGSLPTGSHVKIRADVRDVGGEMEKNKHSSRRERSPGPPAKTVTTSVVRPYTPTRFNNQECELLLRVYPQGRLTRHLFGLKVGDKVEMMGPTGVHRYGLSGPGSFSRGKARTWTGMERILMLAGGTGITPMLQISNHVLSDPNDMTKIHILAFNSTPNDIMLRERLTDMAKSSERQMSINFFCSRTADGEEMPADVEESCMRRMTSRDLLDIITREGRGDLSGDDSAISESTMVCVCGPPTFVKECKATVKDSFANVLVW